jgi:CRP-like cAMP-binding protein
MEAKRTAPFNPQTFLAQVGDSRTILLCKKHQILFAQGDTANAVFYVQAGRVKLSIVSQQGKEAVVAMLEQGDFFGEGCLAGQLVRMATATSLDHSSIVRIDKQGLQEAIQLVRLLSGGESRCQATVQAKSSCAFDRGKLSVPYTKRKGSHTARL